MTTTRGNLAVPIGRLSYGLFFVSGGFALVYQLCWVRRLSLEFGSTSLAVSTVVATFMGGLALGSWAIGKKADGWKAPLATYGWLEILLGCYALLSPWIFDLVLSSFVTVGARFGDSRWTLSLLRLGMASTLLLPPTALMGATLPLLSRSYIITIGGEGGRGAGILYGINTLGAFVGTLAAGFLALPLIGLRTTLMGGGALNILLGLVAVILGTLARTAEPVARLAKPDRQAQPPKLVWAVLAVATITGFASLSSEVVWTRSMILALGSSAYAFTIILAVFLVGLGSGAWATALALRSTTVHTRSWVAWLCTAAGLSIVLSSWLLSLLPELHWRYFWEWDLAERPERLILVQTTLAALILLVPTVFMGGVLPATLRLAVAEAGKTAQSVGRLYALNTLGAVFGSLAAGFVLIPTYGVTSSLALMAGLYVACALLMASVEQPQRKQQVLAVSALVAVAVMVPRWNESLMTSAMYYYAEDHPPQVSADFLRKLTRRREVLYYKDGLAATVTVTRDRASRDLSLTINGKIDGSSSADMATQRLIAHIPLLLHPSPSNVSVIGLGTGATTGSAALHGVGRVTTAEIEGAVVEAAKLFRAHNHAPHEMVNVDIRVTDGRLFLQTHPSAFDVVISQPSNPWQAGNGDLFTSEYFRLGAEALRDGGLFTAWMQTYRLSPDSFRTLVRTFSREFPYAYGFMSFPGSDLILVGSAQPLPLDVARIRQRLANPAVRDDLADARVQVNDVFDLLSHLMLGPNEVADLAGDGPLHTFDLPVVYYRAPFEMHQAEYSVANFRLLVESAPGACAYIRPEGAVGDEALVDNLAGIEHAYRRWELMTPSGLIVPWAAQADVCANRIAALR